MNPEEKELREEFNMNPGDVIDTNIGLLDILGVNKTHVEVGNILTGERWIETHEKFRNNMNGVE